MKKVCIIGLGYIGLPTAIVAAEQGFEVIGYDINPQRVQCINNGDPVIDEPEVFDRLQTLILNKKFYATTTIESADCFVIAVPTPFKENKKADLSYVYNALEHVASVLKKGDVIILESTIPVGTTDYCATMMSNKTGLKAGIDFYMAHCPERVLPGQIFHELVYNARVIGGIDKTSMNQAKVFYKQFVRAHLYLTNATTAEMVKLVENSSRDVEIAFANQVASMAYSIGLNPFEIIELANKHPRVNILNPSCGVGGHCIAVDPWFLIETFPDQAQLLHKARQINDEKPHQVIDCIRSWIKQWHETCLSTPRVLILGLTYKANVNDLRESPALEIAESLATAQDAKVTICEPNVTAEGLPDVLQSKYVELLDGINNADIIVCLVHHDSFKNLQSMTLSNKKILDFCGLFHKPQQDTTLQEKLFWPAHSTTTMAPFEPHLIHQLDHYQEQYS